ncbi:MAG TPA: hypothetical protein VK152_11655 [Paludibacter sp.]|nr:hypothetical protein [Paludibacter sp.]
MRRKKKINQDTPAGWSKVSAACMALSTFIAGYTLTAQSIAVGFVGLGLGFLGTIIPFVTSTEK